VTFEALIWSAPAERSGDGALDRKNYDKRRNPNITALPHRCAVSF